jgi:hypothetical protein
MTNPIEGGPSVNERLVISGGDQSLTPPIVKETLGKTDGLLETVVMVAEVIALAVFG